MKATSDMFSARFDGFSFGCRHRGQRRKTDRPLLCRVRRQSWSQQVRDRQVALVLLIDTYVSREKCTNQVFHHSVDASSTSSVVFVFFLGTKANFKFIEGYEDQHHAQTSRAVFIILAQNIFQQESVIFVVIKISSLQQCSDFFPVFVHT